MPRRGDTAPRRLILPGQSQGRGLTLLVPAGHERKVAFSCEVCGMSFEDHEGQAWERHVGECARRHHAEIQQIVAERRRSPLHEAQWDTEIAEHMVKVGQRMRREGRYIVLPNERAGL